MNYLSWLTFLGALSIVNFLMLISLYLFDLMKVTSYQKIFFIRIALSVALISTFIFCITRFFALPNLELMFYDQLINEMPIKSAFPMMSKSYIDLEFYIFIAYTIGFAIAIFRIIFSYLKSIKQLACSIENQIQEYSVLLSKNIQSPLSFGFPKGKIYLPFNIKEKWTNREIEICLAHEKFHIDRNDTIWKLLSILVKAVLFFSPVAYLFHKKFELEMEILCDEQTRIKTNASKQEYGDLLLAMTSIQANNYIFTNIKTSNLKRRFHAMNFKYTHRPFLVSAFSFALLIAGGTAIATSNKVVESKSIYKITSKIIIDNTLVSQPQIIAKANQKATIILSNNNQNLNLSLIAKDVSDNNIKINYDIQFANGNEKMHSKPVMILVPNQEGVIRMDDSGHSYEMKVIAERR